MPRSTTASKTRPTHRTSPEARTSINLRIETATRKLIDDASAALGKTRTEFMIESARREALDTLLDRRLFSLAEKHFKSFVDALDDKRPRPKLKTLLRRAPVWRA